MDKKEILIRELIALGQYWRNDWSDFDGRTLKSQLDYICHWYSQDKEPDFTSFSDQLNEQESQS